MQGGVNSLPDGGYGWVVVVSAFIVMGLTTAVLKTFGLFFVEIQQHFDELASTTSWITSITIAMFHLGGVTKTSPTKCPKEIAKQMASSAEESNILILQQKSIGILVVVLAVLLIIGCWYYKRRCGYKNLQSKSSHAGTMRRVAGEDAPLDCKALLQEYSNFNSVVPDAPPTYDKSLQTHCHHLIHHDVESVLNFKYTN